MTRTTVRRLLAWIALSLLGWLVVIAGLILFGTAKPPRGIAALTEPFVAHAADTRPERLTYRARDGVQLHYREYPAAGERVAVLVHGAAGSSSDMHLLAAALQQAGISAYVPDVRGHGADVPHGDIRYVGQLEDDLGDLIAALHPRHPRGRFTLIGFSSGGGFALRVAATPSMQPLFERYLLLAPFLRHDAPSLRSETEQGGSAGAPSVNQWASPYIGRIIGLTMLNHAGLHALDGLPVLVFDVPEHVLDVTRSYSWRLEQNFAAHDDYLADIRALGRPTHVFVGDADPVFVASRLRAEFESQRSDVPVTILPGRTHDDLVFHPAAIQVIVAQMLR
jgi:alpha-beta hydrolase superfamily lysophospholipase